MDNINDDFVTRSFLNDVARLTDEARVSGVSAYLQRPRRAPRPNERFLRSTLANIHHANRLVEEEEMWAQHDLQLERTTGGRSSGGIQPSKEEVAEDGRHLHRTLCENPVTTTATATTSSGSKRQFFEEGIVEAPCTSLFSGDEGSEGLERLLSQRKKRGRGGTGSLVDLHGPCEPESKGEGDSRRVKLGPPKPEPLKLELDEDGDGGRSEKSSHRRSRRKDRDSRHRKKEKRQSESSKKAKKKRRRSRSPS